MFCPASVYRTRVTSSPPAGAWISGCIRETGQAPHAPSDLPCACVGTYGSQADTAWECYGNTFYSSIAENLGVVTDPVCHYLGEKVPGTMGFWRYDQAQLGKKMVVCCK